MVQTRAATGIESGQVSSEKGALSKQTTIEPSSRPDKKPREGGAKPSEERPQRTLELNLDVLFLIASYVYPGDLFNLARTCRSLQELLMDKRSAFVWKMARSFTGMPDCPPELTEFQYASLIFGSACHACGKYAPVVLWAMYRRYCSDCIFQRLVPLHTCHEVIRSHDVLVKEVGAMRGKIVAYVDKEQVDSFMSEYDRSSDKDLFLSEKQRQVAATLEHARACMDGLKKMRRQERETCIFDRLVQHGYAPEMNYFSRDEIRCSLSPFFETSRPFTDQEWSREWPKWRKVMNELRNRRIANRLVHEYIGYLHPAKDGPNFLPHLIDLFRLPLFQDGYRALEGTEMDGKSSESVFGLLPMLVDKWRKEFDAQIAELVEIPSHLSLRNPPGDRVAGPSKITPIESSQSATDKLHLACAVFATDCPGYVFLYPEVLSVMRNRRGAVENDPRRARSIENRFDIRHLNEAPYIVRACGLDPNVATVEDMDRRNARLKCLCCQPANTMGWRDAMIHAHVFHSTDQASFSVEGCWEFVDCEYTCATQSAEREYQWSYMRCMLCRPYVGDSLSYDKIFLHLRDRHRLSFVQQGVNCVGLEMRGSDWGRSWSQLC